MVKPDNSTVISLDALPTCDGETDGRADGHAAHS